MKLICLNKTQSKILNEIQQWGRSTTMLETGYTAGGWGGRKRFGSRMYDAAKKLLDAGVIEQTYESLTTTNIQRGERLNGHVTYSSYGFGGAHKGDVFNR